MFGKKLKAGKSYILSVEGSDYKAQVLRKEETQGVVYFAARLEQENKQVQILQRGKEYFMTSIRDGSTPAIVTFKKAA